MSTGTLNLLLFEERDLLRFVLQGLSVASKGHNPATEMLLCGMYANLHTDILDSN